MKRKLYLAALLLTGSMVSAQTHDHNKCLADEQYQQQIQADPSILERALQFEADVDQYEALFAGKQMKSGQKFIIPVVFHVFHAGGPENISKAQIQNQIDTLNRLFNSVHTDRVRSVYHGFVADCEIEFRLASLDPFGNCTDGIVRVYDPETENGSNNLKLKSAWPTDRYLNFWVVKEINSASASLGTTLGYAQFPWAGSAQTDGIVVRHDNVGSIGTALTGLGVGQWGRTLVHEAGHWLGLYHPFQDSCFGGDEVDDTPPVISPSFGCNLNKNSCTNDIPDLPDMIENYMDYADGRCMWAFTIGQKLRMHTTLMNWRPKLWSTSNLIATGVADPYTVTACGPKANFYSTNTDICQGNTINYRNDTYNYSGSGVSYAWEFEGGTPSTSSSINPPNVSYTESGKFKVTLIATQTIGGTVYSDTTVREEFVQVYDNQAMFGAGITENFEFPVFPINGWSYYSTTNANFRRVATGLGSIEGAYALQVPNTEFQDGAIFYFSSPTVDISAIPNPTFSFYYAFSQRKKRDGNNSIDVLSVQASTNCGQTWTTLWTEGGSNLSTIGAVPIVSVNFTPSGAHQWDKVDAPITASKVPQAQRGNVRFRFEFKARGGHNLYIDQINMGFSSGVDAHFSNEGNFTVFPNPTVKEATVRVNVPNSGDVSVAVYDLFGKKVTDLHNGQLEAGEQEFTFNGASLSSGMYIVKMTVDGNSYTRKLMLTSK